MNRPLTVGEAIALVRRYRDWTQGDLAAAAGVSQATVSQIEKGGRQPSMDTLKSLASVLSVSEAMLMMMAQDPSAVPKDLQGLTGAVRQSLIEHFST